MHTPIVLDGKALAAQLNTETKETIKSFGLHPFLAVVSVGTDSASHTYIRNKLKACEEVGIQAQLIELPEHASEYEVVSIINHLAKDETVHGIILQLPLPKHLVAEHILSFIPPSKDVDGFRDDSPFQPCTPEGIIRLLEEYNINLEGNHCVVVGRSKIVGEPLAKMLNDYNATVTVCNSYTPKPMLTSLCRNAGLVFSAVGKPGLIDPYDLQFGSVLVDIGINRDIEGKLCGDFNPDCYKYSYAYTPVPGGVGPMTVATLMQHVTYAALIAKENQNAENS